MPKNGQIRLFRLYMVRPQTSDHDGIYAKAEIFADDKNEIKERTDTGSQVVIQVEKLAFPLNITGNDLGLKAQTKRFYQMAV